MKNKFSVLIIIAALFLAACSSAAPVATAAPQVDQGGGASVSATTAVESGNGTTVSFSKDVWPILEKYAVSAHGGKGGVYLENYDQIMKYVTPGDPENSMLYKVLIGDGVPQMPPDGKLPDKLIQTIYDWIKQGALNN